MFGFVSSLLKMHAVDNGFSPPSAEVNLYKEVAGLVY